MPPPLIRALLKPEAWPHPVAAPRLIETHISWVILTGEFAYKIKRPLDLGFLDFTTLTRRRAACEEELRLNRRLAADIYLGLTPISGTPEKPLPGGPGEPIEYAVRMRQFPAAARLPEQLAAGELRSEDMSAFGQTIAAFHQALAPAEPAGQWGRPEQVWQAVAESLAQLAELLPDPARRRQLSSLSQMMERQFGHCAGLLEERARTGYVRETHGDLHLANLVRWQDRIVAFDALEFDPALRCTDLMAEVAFPVMDLCTRGRPDLAMAFLNSWLSETGDYPGLALLHFFLAARALVRAKVKLLAPAGDAEAKQAASNEAATLLAYAADPVPFGRPAQLLLICGVSGTGKTWLSRELAMQLPAIHLRSDVERKRLAGLAPLDQSKSGYGSGLYDSSHTQRTYAELERLARQVLACGLQLIIDAAALKRGQRAALLRAATDQGMPATIIWLHGPEQLLASRIRQRATRADDASEADPDVLTRQLEHREPPDSAEASELLDVDVSAGIEVTELLARLGTAFRA